MTVIEGVRRCEQGTGIVWLALYCWGTLLAMELLPWCQMLNVGRGGVGQVLGGVCGLWSGYLGSLCNDFTLEN